jgi:hypothetical protein
VAARRPSMSARVWGRSSTLPASRLMDSTTPDPVAAPYLAQPGRGKCRYGG